MTNNHHAALLVSWGGAPPRLYSRYGPFDLELTASAVNPTFWRTASEFFLWGMHHIFVGYDHIAFLLALLLAARRLRSMLKIVTSFTVAHSLTLLLAAMDVIRLPGAVTESLIAASIVYVAAENYFIQEGRYRWMLTFAFGLVHGLGFSSVLRARLQDIGSILVPVVSFNLGVEAGQIAIPARRAPRVDVDPQGTGRGGERAASVVAGPRGLAADLAAGFVLAHRPRLPVEPHAVLRPSPVSATLPARRNLCR